MDILYRNQSPVYRGSNPPPQQARSGFLAGLWCYLFGSGSAPSYRTMNGQGGSAAVTAQKCWWQAFPSTPLYKAAPQVQPTIDASASSGGSATGETTDEDVFSTVYIVTD